MRILMVAGHRLEKLIEPLKCIKANFQIVTLNPRRLKIVSPAREIVDILVETKTYATDVIVRQGAGFVGFTALILAKVIAKPFVSRVAGDIFEDYKTKIAHYKHHGQLRYLIGYLFYYKTVFFIVRHSSGII